MNQSINIKSVESITQDVAEFAKKNGVVISKTEYWGVRKLEYLIKKFKNAHYVMLCFEAPPEFIKLLDHEFRFHNKILRYMFLQIDEFDSEPSLMLKPADFSESTYNNKGEESSGELSSNDKVEVLDKSLSDRALVDSNN